MTGVRRTDESLVELLGPGWDPWRGRWTSRRLLIAGDEGWRLQVDGKTEREWPTLSAAAAELWPHRNTTGTRPWAVGYMTYEACAEHAGDLQRHTHDSEIPAAVWLIEPSLEPGVEVGQQPSTNLIPSNRPGVGASLDDQQFAHGVERIREHIAAGSVYQVNLTRRFTISEWTDGLEPLTAAVIKNGIPPYLSRIRFNNIDILCASMELLLRRRGRQLETAPIKGTRPRSDEPEEDQRLAEELAADPKERAELAMIVDLERNDLGRVAEPGTVSVVDSGQVETFNTVHHRVAHVTAEAETELPWWEALAVIAPGGSITGCPKIAAMHYIHHLEPCPRGPYTGVLGVVAGNGDLEMALPIRTAWHTGHDLHFAAGCGIVWESQATAEVAESRLKVSRWLELGEGSTR